MNFEHETIKDDTLMQLYFVKIAAANELLPVHWHNHLEILYIIDGSITAFINDNSYSLAFGDILIVNPKDIHTTHVQEKCQYYLLQIPPVHLSCIGVDWQLLHFGEYLPAAQNKPLADIFNELIRLDTEKDDGYRLLFLSQIYMLLYHLYQKDSSLLSVQSVRKNERDFKRLEQSMQYVKKNYRRPLSLEEVAAELSISPEYFCRLFKKYTGQTFLTYVNQIRLQHFYQDLLHTEESITYLLEKHGISNYKVFMREFKKAYGTTPHRLRLDNM